MLPDPQHVEDAGFPYPAATLLFDDQAARHLTTAGAFPAGAVAVTGSARLDELLAQVRDLDADAIDAVRGETGAVDGRALVLFAAKEREARGALPALIDAVRSMPDVQLAIKPHPAETPNVYETAVANAPNVHVTGSAAALPALLAAARAVVTVNSTVAIDALALGVPSLVIGLPNNLTPFVEAGLMRGAGSPAEIREALRDLLYDRKFRSSLARTPQGRAAERSAEAILALANSHRT